MTGNELRRPCERKKYDVYDEDDDVDYKDDDDDDDDGDDDDDVGDDSQLEPTVFVSTFIRKHPGIFFFEPYN